MVNLPLVAGCMDDKPRDGFAKCYWITTKALYGDRVVNVYESYRAMASSDAARNFRQIYSGMTSEERQCLTCDVDMPFTDSSIDKIRKICLSNELPLPTNIVINTRKVLSRPDNDQYHYQIQWELDVPFYAKNWAIQERSTCDAKNNYLNILKMLAMLFGGDLNYRGLWHKNAYCTKDIKRIPVSDKEVSLSDILGWYKSSCTNFENSRCTKRQPVILKNSKLYPADAASSRNCYMVGKLPTKIYSYAYKNGRFPSEAEAIEMAVSLEKESLKFNKKSRIETISAIELSAKRILEMCKSSYNADLLNRRTTRQDFGRMILCTNRSINASIAKSYLNEKIKKKEIARRLHVDANTVTKYLRMEIPNIKRDLDRFISFYENSPIQKYAGLYEQAKGIVERL